MMRSGNPALGANTFTKVRAVSSDKAMNIQGTVNKTFILLFLAVFSASWVWGKPVSFLPLMWPALIAGMIVAFVTIFKKDWSPITAPIYALIEGVFLGVISALIERSYPGIVIQAVGLTFSILLCLLIAYKSKMIKVTDNFRLGIVAATGGIALLYIVSMVLGAFGTRIPF
ncbi:MAG: Bax inhibitor-1/YccA family protein, partial [Candidatus Omnitrophica bacterium]|nr:Bax inhibitor-1/YccA family protein [Candidatus Omnitrophota bacterium]